MKPIFRTDQPHELAVLEAALDPKGRRFATLAEDEARGVRLGPEDAQFAREYGRRNPEIAADIALFAQIGALGTPRDAGNELSDAEFAARALKTVAEKAGAQRGLPPERLRPTRSTGRGRAMGALAAVALVAAVLVAYAAEMEIESRSARRALDEATIRRALEAARGLALAPTSDVVSGSPQERDAAGESRPRPAAVPSSAPARTQDPTSSQASGPTADQMLRRAQDLLADGRRHAAIGAYRELVTRHGTSAEARAALVSLGQLLLAEGEPHQALGYFEQYVRGAGPLGEEARYGRIQALARLGEPTAEVEALEEFLRRYPSSVHADRLRTRLGLLRGN